MIDESLDCCGTVAVRLTYFAADCPIDAFVSGLLILQWLVLTADQSVKRSQLERKTLREELDGAHSALTLNYPGLKSDYAECVHLGLQRREGQAATLGVYGLGLEALMRHYLNECGVFCETDLPHGREDFVSQV
jgi:hypothetical protein